MSTCTPTVTSKCDVTPTPFSLAVTDRVNNSTVLTRCANYPILTLPSKYEHLQILLIFICVYLFLVFASVITVNENVRHRSREIKNRTVNIPIT